MGGCLSKSKPVEVKVELTLLEKEKEADVMSPNGKASPFSECRPNGALGHCSDEDAAAAPLRLYKPRDYVEASVCHVKDMENGQMREVDLGSGRALLIKEHGEFSAIGHKCPHYGAPLVKGVLSKGHVRCPWHGACFNIATGDIEDFPGLDSLPTFQVRVEKDKVIIRANKQDLQSQKRSKAMARCSAVINSSTGFSYILIVGSGPAGLVCAETLRQEGFTDRIVMCTMDKYPPYDRPKLSKSLESTAEQLRLRSIDFLQAHDIELLTEKEAVAVDVKTKAVTFQDGSRMEYRKLFIATGSKPKPMNYKGQDVRNVFHLRTPEDANSVARLANNKNAVIVGTSFVGMEVAAALTDKAHSVSIIGIEAVPFRKALGEKVGKAIMKLFETNRVKFYMLNEVSEMVGHHGQLKEVVLKSGKVLRADVCVIGTGSGPATGFLKQSGVHMDSKGFVPVNKTMQTNIDGVYAGGDIVTFPFPGRSNKKVNIPHWQMAHVHGRVAALGMMGRPTEIKTVPYFWSAMFGKSLRYAGYGEGFDDVVIQGDVDELKFVAFYTRSEEVVAVASMNYDPIVSRVAEVLGSGKTIRKRDVELLTRQRKTGDMSWLIDKGSQ
ncbi:apoptosis-inducing factor 3 isoform X1 [Coregonus clupeaformis]|uniref:apoptosis-inducing factor 3 isoform X1 n=2 Tax=Coregonus clupeaformis TaxID=59861 RepID=UPI001BE0EB92|nr:apoptosis-inducing factor 3 isoform X1 [Coregonus clupeaformis]XP_041718256.1 apoptosis-inducing factor 3 isoform X1 [Coregonus clupeaformis]XP_041718257.1 apoptosis-inducing factor 3 isoform X1 [Coregonus clupeaformis]